MALLFCLSELLPFFAETYNSGGVCLGLKIPFEPDLILTIFPSLPLALPSDHLGKLARILAVSNNSSKPTDTRMAFDLELLLDQDPLELHHRRNLELQFVPSDFGLVLCYPAGRFSEATSEVLLHGELLDCAWFLEAFRRQC